MKISSTYIVIAVAIAGVMLIGGSKFLGTTKEQMTPEKEGKYMAFAECLAEKGAKFYGAFWCPHCKEQKEMFNDASTKLPYIECSTPDKKNQTQVCIDAGIESYPTWILANGEHLNGVISLEKLAEKTSCTLP